MKKRVFLNCENRPQLLMKWGGNWWLFYWHEAEKHWVSERNVQNEKDQFPDNLSEEDQNLYMDLHYEWEEGGRR